MADFINELVWANSRPLGSHTDLDNVRKPGFYSVTDPAGLPAGNYHLQVITGGGYGTKQRIMNVASDLEYVRQKTDAGFSTWAAFGLGGGGAATNSRAEANQFSVTPIAGTSTLTAIGCSSTTAGSAGNITFGGTNVWTLIPGVAISGPQGANQLAGYYVQGINLARDYGFDVTGIVAFSDDLGTTGVVFAGLGLSYDRMVATTGIGGAGIGIGFDVAVDSGLMLYHSSGTGAPSFVALLDSEGSAITFDATTSFSVKLSADAEDTEIAYVVTNLKTGQSASGAISSNIPPAVDTLEFQIASSTVNTEDEFAVPSVIVHSVFGRGPRYEDIETIFAGDGDGGGGAGGFGL